MIRQNGEAHALFIFLSCPCHVLKLTHELVKNNIHTLYPDNKKSSEGLCTHSHAPIQYRGSTDRVMWTEAHGPYKCPDLLTPCRGPRAGTPPKGAHSAGRNSGYSHLFLLGHVSVNASPPMRHSGTYTDDK